eukprot:6041255-Karenia_brevis.AAC.1
MSLRDFIASVPWEGKGEDWTDKFLELLEEQGVVTHQQLQDMTYEDMEWRPGTTLGVKGFFKALLKSYSKLTQKEAGLTAGSSTDS